VALVVGAVLALVAVGLFALRPDSGQSADGSERQAPTTTIDVPVESSEADASAEDEPTPLVAEFVETEIEEALREVAVAGIGYLAVLDTVAPSAQPPLVRSIDGISWSLVDAEVVELDDLDLIRSRFAGFVGLRETEDGFAILRARQEFIEPGRVTTGFFVVDRLVSNDGATWVPDSTFSEVVVRQAVPFTTGNDDLILSTSGPIPTTSALPFIPSFTEALSNFDCSPRGSSIDLLVLDGCGAGPGDGPQDDAVAGPVAGVDCGSDFLLEVAASSSVSEFRLIESAGATGSFSAVGLLTSPQVSPSSGMVAALTRAIPEAPADCDFTALEIPDDRPLAIQVWDQPGSGTSIPLIDVETAGIDEAELATAVALGWLGDGVVVATTENLLRVGLDGTVDQLRSLNSVDITAGVPGAYPSEDGLELVDVRNGVLQRWTITDEGTDVSSEPVFEQAGFARVTYADADLVVTFSPNDERAIRLPDSAE